MSISDIVSLSIPLKARFVSIARLTASGVSSGIGFDYDAIEDIKVALSEVLNQIIERQPTLDAVTIDFACAGDGISIAFRLPDPNMPSLFDRDEDSFALAIIRSLMDEVDFNKKDQLLMTMTKKLGKAV